MRVLFVASEVAPYAKTGGLADVAGSLPKALQEAGHQVWVVMPRYKCISKKDPTIKPFLKRIRLRIGKGAKEFNIYASRLPNSSVPVYFIDKDLYFNRHNLYIENGQEYPDNAERFHYFSLAVLEMLKILDIQPDIIHCNDWQSAMIPVYLKTILNKDKFYQDIATVYTIHNLAYQGVFPDAEVKKLGLPDHLFTPEALEFWGQINFAKAGLVFADLITTVSPTYSKEIQTSEYGCGLEGVLRERSASLFGIINGIDQEYWNPETDPYIKQGFSKEDVSQKIINKQDLCLRNNLEFRPETPVFGLISRLVDQKGFDILFEAMDSLCAMDIQLFFLVSSEPKYEELLFDYERKYSEKLRVHVKYDAELAQQIYAGSDTFLMPSRFEPCGLGQLISLRYGTVPIVRATGGLGDTVIDIDDDPDSGNGFVFKEYSSKALIQCVERVLNIYKSDKLKWQSMQIRGMQADFSWLASAYCYTELYKKACMKSQEN